MTADARLQWLHRGVGTRLELRVTTDRAGALVLVSPDKARLHIADLDTAGVHDVTLAPGALAELPPSTFSLELLTPDGSSPVLTDRGAATGYGGLRTVVAGVAVEVRFRPRADGPAVLELVPRDPWAEVVSEEVAGTRVTWIVTPRGATDTTAATGVLVERDTGQRHGLETTRDGDHLRVSTDLRTLPPGSDERTYDLWLQTSTLQLRVGRHDDDLPHKSRSIVPHRCAIEEGDLRWSVTPRYTDRNNVSVTVGAQHGRGQSDPDPLAGWQLSHAEAAELGDDPEQRTDRLHLGHRLAAWVASTLFAALGAKAARSRRGRPAPAPDGRRHIHLLIAVTHATGGTIRATINTANALAAAPENQVDLVSVYRILEDRYYAVDPAVRSSVLVDRPWIEQHGGRGLRGVVRRFALRVPSVLIHADDPRAHRFSLFTDLQLYRWLRSVRHGTIVPTRSGLAIVAARFARPGTAVVAQQHVPFRSQTPGLQAELAGAYARSDAVCVLTTRDEAEVREALGDSSATTIVRTPNALFDTDPPAPDLDAPRIICGGRLTPTKGTDLLISAFREVAATHPDWELRVYGSARADRLDAVREMVRRASLHDRVRLVPPSQRFDLELVKGSVCVVPSRHEAFGMVIIEAMRCGVPVVAFDCPSGPREIITDGEDGLLVPAEDVGAFAAALGRLMNDPALRRRLAAGGRRTAERYAPRRVAAELEAVIDAITGAPQITGGRP